MGRAQAPATVAISGGPAPSTASAVLCVLVELLKAWLHHLRSKTSVSLAAGFLTVEFVGKKLLVLDQGISSSSYWEKNEMVGNQSSNILAYVAVLWPWRAQGSGYPEDEGELPQATDHLRKRDTRVQTIFIAFR